MTNMQTGFITVLIVGGALLIWAIALRAAATHWSIALRAIWYETKILAMCTLISIVIFAAGAGLVWAIGLLVNTVWSIFA